MGNHLQGRNRKRAGSLLRAAVALLILGGVPVGGLTLNGGDESLAQMSGSGSLADFKSGQVTDRKGHQIEIDKKDYALQANVTVRDDEGRPRDLKEVTPGTFVQFHLKQGRIDQIVLELPR